MSANGEKNGLFQSEEVNEVNTQVPQISLLRGEDKIETDKFLPGDLLTLEISNLGDWKSTVVLLTDVKNENRYKARRRGRVVVFGTKLQKTKRFGRWVFHIEAPLETGETVFIEKAFEVCKTLPPVPVAHISTKMEGRGDILTEVPGIGPTYFKRLKNEGIVFYLDLLESDIETVKKVSKAPIAKVRSWFTFVAENSGKEVPIFEQVDEKKDAQLKLTELKGIGAKTAERLHSMGISTIEDLANANIDAMVSTFGEGRARNYINAARTTLKLDPVEIKSKKPLEKSELLQIKGIGPAYKSRLEQEGIGTRDQLLQLSPTNLARILNCTEAKARTILNNAGNVKMDVEEDNPINVLTKIPGIGPTYAKRLIEHGITTYEKIAATDEEILKKVTKANLSKVKAWKNFVEG